MLPVLNIVLLNACLAAVFAVVIFLVQRTGRMKCHPSLWHALWLLVLIKLAMPPIVTVPVAVTSQLDDPVASSPAVEKGEMVQAESLPARRAIIDEPVLAADAVSSSRFDVGMPDRETMGRAAVATSLVGTLALLCISLSRVRKIGRLVRHAEPGPDWLHQVALESGNRLDLACSPSVRIVHSCVTPFLWVSKGAPIIVMPAELVLSLPQASVGLVVTHELAHYARRDHWTNSLVMMLGALFWWNPVFWWSRHQLRLAQELCCDAMVLRTDAGHRQRYAETLLKTVDFVASGNSTVPAPAAAFGSCKTFRRRIEMICRSDLSDRTPRTLRLLVAIPALLLVTAFPAVANDDHDVSADQVAQLRAELRAVHERLAKLDSLMEAILDRRHDVADHDRGDRARGDRERLERDRGDRAPMQRDHPPRGRGEPDRDRADSFQRDSRRVERDVHADHDHGRPQRIEMLEREMHELQRRIAEDPDGARTAHEELHQIREALEREHHSNRMRRYPASPDRLRAEIQDLEGEAARLTRERRHAEAREVRGQINERVNQLRDRERHVGDEHRRRDEVAGDHHAQIRELELQAKHHAEQGNEEAAEDVRRVIAGIIERAEHSRREHQRADQARRITTSRNAPERAQRQEPARHRDAAGQDRQQREIEELRALVEKLKRELESSRQSVKR